MRVDIPNLVDPRDSTVNGLPTLPILDWLAEFVDKRYATAIRQISLYCYAAALGRSRCAAVLGRSRCATVRSRCFLLPVVGQTEQIFLVLSEGVRFHLHPPPLRVFSPDRLR